MKHFLYQLRRVKIKEAIEIWKLPIAIILAFFYRMKHRDLWIVSEDKNEARDNGYWFYKYMREKHPKQECIYAISGKSPDLEKIASIGDWVEYGSLRHWTIYLASSKKISSQKAGNPNAALFYFLEVYGFLKDKRVFLQHGITKDDARWLYYNVTKMDRFICGAYPEFEYIDKTFGYPKGNVCYTGFCRFDGWHTNSHLNNRIVLIMPTWREWIADEDYRLEAYEGTKIIPETEYFRMWIGFLNDPQIEIIAKDLDVRFVFYPHRNMQKYMNYFPKSTKHLTLLSAKDADIQQLLRDASMMITDYSSVFFDMLYMKKPVVYYQFDYNKFRQRQYGEGYFDYKDNPFGHSYATKEEVFGELKKIIENSFVPDERYIKAHAEYFPLYDQCNCERVYQVTKQL